MKFTAYTTDRLDKYLATQTGVSRGRVQSAIKSGLVKVNSQSVSESDYKINPGDVIDLPEFVDESLQPMEYNLKIEFENDDIVVIDKPANLVVHPGAGHKQDTLSNVLIGKYPEIISVGDPTRPGIIHRLDEDTSGLIVTAKTQSGYDYMKNLFMTRQIQKEYLTLVHGVPSKLHDVINEPIGRSSTHVKMKVGIGKEAVTEYNVLQTNEQKAGVDKMALIRVKLHTGRTHQIRVHMAHIGHPVVGDQLYGGTYKQGDAKFITRQFLHAARLKFQLPNGTHIDLESPLPEDLQAILKQVSITN
jgi:23S rRNA pseudouridine1911/1915/1917 synthase